MTLDEWGDLLEGKLHRAMTSGIVVTFDPVELFALVRALREAGKRDS